MNFFMQVSCLMFWQGGALVVGLDAPPVAVLQPDDHSKSGHPFVGQRAVSELPRQAAY
ncbi:hypothetical protein [Herbaspirillum sp. LeCh32-8]|uniref:hypothetical protein n=1 Tax=Herbaspirillum sp. LeCh32-8 TaxID=2821356 RepID=UPI001AE9A3D4|nr:hypothetical protein [Herbaspirillum sp. LeCh32-8]